MKYEIKKRTRSYFAKKWSTKSNKIDPMDLEYYCSPCFLKKIISGGFKYKEFEDGTIEDIE